MSQDIVLCEWHGNRVAQDTARLLICNGGGGMAGAAADEPSLAPQWLKGGAGGGLGAGSTASRIVKSSPAAEEGPAAGRQGMHQGVGYRARVRVRVRVKQTQELGGFTGA